MGSNSLPQWVKTEYGVSDVIRKKMGLIILATGELLEPMYSRKLIDGGMVLTRKRELPELRQCQGENRFFGFYSTWPAS